MIKLILKVHSFILFYFEYIWRTLSPFSIFKQLKLAFFQFGEKIFWVCVHYLISIVNIKNPTFLLQNYIVLL